MLNAVCSQATADMSIECNTKDMLKVIQTSFIQQSLLGFSNLASERCHRKFKQTVALNGVIKFKVDKLFLQTVHADGQVPNKL